MKLCLLLNANAAQSNRSRIVKSIVACLLCAVLTSSAVSEPVQQRRNPNETSRRTQQRTENQPNNKFGYSAPKPRTPGAIRLATYNMLNFFDPFDDPTLQGEHDDAGMVTEERRCKVLAQTIRAVDADILALQEVESLEALTWFRDNYLKDMGYKYIASYDVGYYRGIECSVMSRFPITDARVWPNMSLDNVQRPGPGWSEIPPESRRGLTFQRSPLCAKITIDVDNSEEDYELIVFSVHHKAGGDNRFHREAEAVRIVEFINQLRSENPAANIIVMGDFNAAPWDKSVRLYLEAGMIDTLAHRIIPRWRNADETEASLYKTHESGRVIDFVLLSSGAHREFVVGSAHVFGTMMPPESYDWRKDPKPEGYPSDHYPIIIDMIPGDRE